MRRKSRKKMMRALSRKSSDYLKKKRGAITVKKRRLWGTPRNTQTLFFAIGGVSKVEKALGKKYEGTKKKRGCATLSGGLPNFKGEEEGNS